MTNAMNFKEALIAHKYADVLRWIADGEKIQWDRDGAASWVNANADQVLYAIGSGAAVDPSRFRLAPRTITVNGVEVPAPESVAPVVGATYYIPTPDTEELWSERWNQCSDVTGRHIERGLVYLNKEDAIARAKAMLLYK